MIKLIKSQKLGVKFTFVLSLVFVIGIVVGGLVLWQALYRISENEIALKGLLLIDTMTSVRDYTSANIQPLLKDRLQTEDKFIRETVPAFSAITVFSKLQATNPQYVNFKYLESTLNPTNPRDKADDFETSIVTQMQKDSTMTQSSGFRLWNNTQMYYIARPLKVSADSCLSCHGDPATALKSQLAAYGSSGGFGWKVGDIVGAKIIYIPADEVFNTTLRSSTIVIGVFIAVFALAIFVLNRQLRRYVLAPVMAIDQLALKIRDDKLQTQDLNSAQITEIATHGDELGDLARIFTKMAEEVYTRTQHLKEQVRELNIQINEIKAKKEVEEITGTDFFRALQSKADDLRKKTDKPPTPSSE